MYFDVVHRAGIKHQADDAISHLYTDREDRRLLDDYFQSSRLTVCDPLCLRSPRGREVPSLLVSGGTADISEDEMYNLENQYDPESITPRGASLNAVLTIHAVDDSPATSLSPVVFLHAQKEDHICQKYAISVGKTNSDFYSDRPRFLVRCSKVDSSLQRLVAVALHQCMLTLKHSPVPASPPGARGMYDTMRQDLYWPHISNDVYHFVRHCQSCTRVRGHIIRTRNICVSFHRRNPSHSSPWTFWCPCHVRVQGISSFSSSRTGTQIRRGPYL